MKFNEIEEKSFLKKIMIYLKIDSKFGFILALAFATISIALYFYLENSDTFSWFIRKFSNLFFWGDWYINMYLMEYMMDENGAIDNMQFFRALTMFVFIASMILKTILIYYVGKFLEFFYYKKKIELAEKPSKDRKKIVFKKIMLWFSRIAIFWILAGFFLEWTPLTNFGIESQYHGLGSGIGVAFAILGIYFVIFIFLIAIYSY